MKGESALGRDFVRAHLGGVEVDSPDLLVIGGRVAARRHIGDWRDASAPQDAAEIVLVHLDELPANAVDIC